MQACLGDPRRVYPGKKERRNDMIYEVVRCGTVAYETDDWLLAQSMMHSYNAIWGWTIVREKGGKDE